MAETDTDRHHMELHAAYRTMPVIINSFTLATYHGWHQPFKLQTVHLKHPVRQPQADMADMSCCQRIINCTLKLHFAYETFYFKITLDVKYGFIRYVLVCYKVMKT